MIDYPSTQRIESSEFGVAINYSYFYNLMWNLHPDLMMDLELKNDYEDYNLNNLYIYAHSKLKMDSNPLKLQWITFAILYIFNSDPLEFEGL